MTRDVAVALCSLGIPGINNVLIISFYWDIHYNAIPDAVLQALEYAKDRNLEIIMMADTNAKNTIWNSTTTNPRGTLLEDTLLEYDMAVVNQGDTATFVRVNCATFIDVTAMTPRLAAFLSDWYVDPEFAHSDHRVITFKIQKTRQIPTLTRSQRKTDWDKYRMDLATAFSESDLIDINDINTIDDIELALDKFYTILNSVNDKHCKLKPTRSTPIINKWWTSELNDLSDKTKAAFDRYKRRRTDECREEYNALATEFKYAVKKARERSFQSFVSETSNLSGMATLSRILRKPKGQEIGLLQDSEGRLTDSPEATCQVLLDHAFKESSPTTNRQMDTILQNVREHVQGS